jgi:formamidopyrimidine-DNA glycosylase
MNGDWEFGKTDEELPRFARAVLDFTDGTRLIFVDSRALGTIDLHAADARARSGSWSRRSRFRWTADQLGAALAVRRGPIKPALLDQKLIAGLGNIYAAEALWRAKIDPRAPSNSSVASACESAAQGDCIRARSARRDLVTPMTIRSASTCMIAKVFHVTATRRPSSELRRRGGRRISVRLARNDGHCGFAAALRASPAPRM